jgi:hypothetical protein
VKTTTKNSDGDEVTTTRDIVEASWMVRSEDGSPASGIRVAQPLPADLAAALEKFHDDSTKAAIASAD